ncbi:MAG: hypothetical protein JNK53_00610, partial [Phycisphaerae bacterium]|nr:hypothetical protein [Phycisphaerae bacterium]
MTRVKFLANTMPDALAAARREFGPDVQVVHAAERRSGGPWPFARTVEAVVIAQGASPSAHGRNAPRTSDAADVRLRLAARLGLAHAVSAAHQAALCAVDEADSAMREARAASEHESL